MTTSDFPLWLRQAMTDRNETVRGLADALGTSASTIQAWRRGVQIPREAALARIASHFDTPLADLQLMVGPEPDAAQRPGQPIYLRVSIPSQELVIRAEALGTVALSLDPATADLERQLLEQFRTLKPTDQASLVDAVATMAATAAALDAGALPGQQRRQRKGA